MPVYLCVSTMVRRYAFAKIGVPIPTKRRWCLDDKDAIFFVSGNHNHSFLVFSQNKTSVSYKSHVGRT